MVGSSKGIYAQEHLIILIYVVIIHSSNMPIFVLDLCYTCYLLFGYCFLLFVMCPYLLLVFATCLYLFRVEFCYLLIFF